ncbi:MAG TPA: glycosyltransferase family 1 protein [Opitutaceae bacterium]|nr:glycosyltransferase family 1 protein [Opitutaceae bacterium]
MKIGLSTSVIQRGRSGVGQYVFALVRALLASADRYEFSLFVLEEDLPLFEFARGAMRLVPVSERFRPPAKNILWHQVELPRLARRLGLDVLHVPSYRRLLWPKPCALVATIHDLAPFRVPKKYDWMRMLYGRVVVRQLAHRQDEIVAVSDATAQDLERFFEIPRARVTVIHNGLDHARFTPEGREEAGALVGRRDGVKPPFFLYVARLEHPAKNHARLIAAFNRFKTESPSPWQLVFSGADWHGAEIVHELIRRSPFAADIRCLGFVPDAELATWYRAATVFVYPSLFEGFGLPPLEAMACGCPVLASSDGAVGEVCAGAAACADPTDVADLAHQLTQLATHPSLREKLRARGLARARQFDWRNTAAATLEVYARAAARAKAPSLAPAFARPAH